jgi:membrane glycosyltransferase
MADVENELNDSLVATVEPDEEANRRCSLQISAVLCLVLTAVSAVVWPMFIYYGLTASKPIPPLVLVLLSSCFLCVAAIFWSMRHSVWRNVCELCNPEKESQIDAQGYLN